MTDRHAPTPAETLAAAFTALDQAEAELKNMRSHLTAGMWAAMMGQPVAPAAYNLARTALIVASTVGRIAEDTRDMAARESLSDEAAV